MPTYQILASHLWIARYAAGTADADTLPAADNAAWIKAGVIGNHQVTRDVQKTPIMAPSPGRLRRVAVLESGATTDNLFTVRQGDRFLWELLFGTLALTPGSSVQYNPNEGAQLDGWVKVQQYDQTDTLINTVVQWCHLQIGGAVTFGEQPVEYQILAEELHSTLNSGTLATLT